MIIQGFILLCFFLNISLADAVTAKSQMFIMVCKSLSLSSRTMRGVNFPHFGARKMYSSKSNPRLGWVGFFAFFIRTRKVFAIWSIHIYVFYGCLHLIENASSPRFYQHDCSVSHLGYATWMVCEDQGCLSVLGCLQRLEVGDLSHLSQHETIYLCQNCQLLDPKEDAIFVDSWLG